MLPLWSCGVADAGCYNCDNNRRLEDLPVRENILCERGWRAAHAFDTSLPGWLVLAPMRHVTALHELTPDEASAMGELLVRLSQALRTVVGCDKTYAMLFAEAEGYAHVHIHVVPRMPDFEEGQIGPQVFTFLGRPPGERLSDEAQDRIAADVRDVMSSGPAPRVGRRGPNAGSVRHRE
jgi:diadenosine tetraphosphate (Ap4A) HIT family hydrolase